MFALVDLNRGIHGKISYAAGAERFAELVEIEGLYPAKVHAPLALRPTELKRLVAERTAILSAKSAAKSRSKPTAKKKRQTATAGDSA